MLRWRLLSSTVLITALVLLVWVDYHYSFGRPGIWLMPLALVITILATGELLGMLRQRWQPAGWSIYTGTLLVVLAAGVPLLWETYPANCPVGRLGWPLLSLTAAVGLAFVAEMIRFRGDGTATVHVGLAVLAIGYVGLLTACLVALRQLDGNRWGMTALLSLIVTVKCSDSGAYAVGRAFGRHRLAPRLSPKKTVEGAIGGLASACLVSWLALDYFFPFVLGARVSEPVLARALGYGLAVGAAGMVGDLAESLLKRDVGCKDSGSWLPGLGGILDVMDSLLAAAPVALVWWGAGWLGP